MTCRNLRGDVLCFLALDRYYFTMGLWLCVESFLSKEYYSWRQFGGLSSRLFIPFPIMVVMLPRFKCKAEHAECVFY